MVGLQIDTASDRSSTRWTTLLVQLVDETSFSFAQYQSQYLASLNFEINGLITASPCSLLLLRFRNNPLDLPYLMGTNTS